MNMEMIRHQNFQCLMHTEFDGCIEKLADAMQEAPATVMLWLDRGIDSRTARTIEYQLALNDGELDLPSV
ncbi:MAG TPA: hypothetical protein DCZ03_00535 [Gammaproteobacteria bacterium]|nr:hypothetical protein [Gammaproteobacteria bacterium]